MHSVVIAGHVCVDFIPELPEASAVRPGELLEIGPLTVQAGGCVANTGGDLAALGADVRGTVPRSIWLRRPCSIGSLRTSCMLERSRRGRVVRDQDVDQRCTSGPDDRRPLDCPCGHADDGVGAAQLVA